MMKNKLILFVSSNLFIGAAFHMMYLKVNQNAYISIILGTLLGILNIYIFNKLKNKNNNNIFFKVLFILFNLYIILLTLTIIPLFVNYFYLVESPKWLILTPFLGVSMYIAYKGKNTLCKLSNLVFIINIFLILTTFLLLTGNFKLENILPILDTSSMNIFKTSIIYSSFSSIPIITTINYGNDSSSNYKLYILSSFILLIISLATTLSLGPDLITTYSFPSYMVLKKINILDFIENIENFLAYIWYFNFIITLAVSSLNIKESVNNNKFIYYIIILFIYYLSINIFGEHYSYTKYIFDIFPVVSYSFLGIIVIYILFNRKTNNQ